MRAQVAVPAKTGLAEDIAVNTWGVDASVDVGTWQASYIAALENFYDALQPYMSSLYTWQAARVKLYNMADPIPRVPIFDLPLGLTGSFPLNTLPQEVALCLSFQGAKISGENQARRRGRIFLGPFSSSAADTGTGRPEDDLITAVSDTANTLLTTSNAATGWKWAVISVTGPTAPNATVVTNGWVDNAWDTQRRRGNKAGARTLFPLA
jgi:hypothetical protein